jgi:hypothetical protein
MEHKQALLMEHQEKMEPMLDCEETVNQRVRRSTYMEMHFLSTEQQPTELKAYLKKVRSKEPSKQIFKAVRALPLTFHLKILIRMGHNQTQNETKKFNKPKLLCKSTRLCPQLL